MTKDVQVPDAVQEQLRRHFSERQVIELTVLIGTYNMHTRVCQALEVERRASIDKWRTSNQDQIVFSQMIFSGKSDE